jgi:transmembrane sensor
MKLSAHPAADIEAQAATWLARRDAVCDEAESAEFTAWLAADPRHRAAYLRLAAAWQRSARLKRLRPEGDAIDVDLLKPGQDRAWRSRWRPLLAITAGVAGVAAVAIWWVASGVEQAYRTDIGGLSRVLLKDGSTLTLNTDTEVRVHFSKARRQVQLLKGEAQFLVAHDTTRPFEVLAGGHLVRAVGTAFDVKLDHGQSMEVLVTEGRVTFLEAAGAAEPASATAVQPETVSAGESAIATREKVTVRRVTATEVSRHLAWQLGELSFQGETLSEAVAEFNRYNRKKLRVDDPGISGLQIGGSFQALDVDSFVAALNHSFGITAAIAGDGTVVLSGHRADSSPSARD